MSIAGFDVALAAIEGVDGWLSEAQARRLFAAAAAAAPGATIAEIGSFRGRSTIVLALAAPQATVVAIDPHAGGDRGPQEIAPDRSRGDADEARFRANLERAGVAARVHHVRRPSSDAHGDLSGPLDVLYVDGAHRYGPARDDIARWGARVAPGGRMLIHDAFSSIGVTLAVLRELVAGRTFVYVGRSRSLAEYVRPASPPSAGARARSAVRQLAALPWFARNVAIKLAIVTRLPAAARALGHDPRDAWPY